MGIIIVDEIMVLHLMFSLMPLSKRNLVGCQLVGLIGVFATFASAMYHVYLSELINTLSKVFNPKDLSHLKFHFYAIMIGLLFSMFSIIIEDIGITCFESCGTARGSILEFLYVIILVMAWPYCLWSAIQCVRKLRRNQAVLSDQKQLYLCHILNIGIFTLTWVPYVLVHFLSFALKLDLADNQILRTFILSLVALTPLLNTLTRVFCDPSLKAKLAFWRKSGILTDSMMMQAEQRYANAFKGGDPALMDSLMEDKTTEKPTNASVLQTPANPSRKNHMSG